MSVKCILFDADGVVITPKFMFSLKYGQEYGVKNEEMLSFFAGEFKKCLTGEADLKKEVAPYLSKWKWSGSVDEFINYWFQAEHVLDQELIELVTHLREKGMVCCLATNQEKYRANYISKKMGLEKIFDRLFFSSEIRYKKPDVEFFQYILAELKNDFGINKEEVVFFDDSKKFVAGGEAAGIKSVFYEKENFYSLLSFLI